MEQKKPRPQNQFELPPIFAKEMLGRMRNARTYTILTVYLGVVCAMTLFLYLGAAIATQRVNSNNGAVGIGLFTVLVAMQVVLACFIAPVFTATAISSERERRTYDSLRATPLGAQHIVLSKFFSALGYVLLAVLATLPLFSVVFVLGGIETVQVWMAVTVIVASAFLFTALGLFISSRMQSSIGSFILTYAIMLGIVVGAPIVLLVGGPLLQRLVMPPASAIIGPPLSLTTGMVIASVIAIVLLSVSPITAIVVSQLSYQETQNALTVPSPFLAGMAGNGILLPSPFILLGVLYLLMGCGLLALATRRLRQAEPL